jgi:hypothetical protein
MLNILKEHAKSAGDLLSSSPSSSGQFSGPLAFY